MGYSWSGILVIYPIVLLDLTLLSINCILLFMSYYPTTAGNVTITASSTGTYAPPYSNPYVYTTSGSTYTGASNFPVSIKASRLELSESADIMFGEVSLMETLRAINSHLGAINSQLGVLTPDPKLEAEFEELKACAQEYERLREKFLEQKKIWDTLKRQDI
jgi:hypothetical protein